MVKFAFEFLEYSEYSEDNMDAPGVHIPVMPKEVCEALKLSADAVYIDGTVGCGGHALQLFSQPGSSIKLIGIDRDGASLEVARTKLADYQNRVTLVHDDFRNLDRILVGLRILEVDAVLLDLGISSFQMDNPNRGFSLKAEGPLDMRMDQASFISAYDLINSLSEREISLILKNYGEERFHHRIALCSHRCRWPAND
jgi:16S rRNA (cytosine1402-N4)-methyltransferase